MAAADLRKPSEAVEVCLRVREPNFSDLKEASRTSLLPHRMQCTLCWHSYIGGGGERQGAILTWN